MAPTMRTTITDDNDQENDDDNDVTTMTMVLFFQATTNLQPWSDAFLAEGGVGDFYDDDYDEDDNDGNNNEDNHRHYIIPNVLPMQSTAMATVRTTTMTQFFDATTNLMEDAFLAEWGVV